VRVQISFRMAASCRAGSARPLPGSGPRGLLFRPETPSRAKR
jgi:hypothetical protein